MPLYKSDLILSTHARSVKREGHNLTKKENMQILRLLQLLHSSAVMLVNTLRYCGYRDSHSYYKNKHIKSITLKYHVTLKTRVITAEN